MPQQKGAKRAVKVANRKRKIQERQKAANIRKAARKKVEVEEKEAE